MLSISNFSNRYSVGDTLAKSLRSFFNEEEIEIVPFGAEQIFKDNIYLKEFIATPNSNFSHSAMMVKFAPDFILLKKTKPQQLYFIETKDSITPLCFQKIIDEIEKKNGRKVPISDIGIIAREAWNAYRNLFPNLIIVSAATYNKSLLKAQFVNKIKCLRCFSESGKKGYDCSLCPVNDRKFFPYVRNTGAAGSQTPHTNIDLGSFMEFDEFFNELGINVNTENIEKFKVYLKGIGVKFSKKISENQKESIEKSLIDNGCYWIKNNRS